MRRRLALLPALLLVAAGLSIARAEDPVALLETTAELRGHEGLVRTLAFGPKGEILASGGPDRTLRIWRVETAEAIATLTLPRSG